MSTNELIDKTSEGASSFTELVKIQYFNKDNAVFYIGETGFVCLKAFMPPVKKDDLEEDKSEEPVWQDLGRVYFHRAFPFELPDQFVSVQDKEGKEYGIIKDLADLEAESIENVKIALARKYFTPIITKIHSLKERFGYSYWTVDTDKGKMNFTLQDTFRSIARVSEVRLVITDIDGNRYYILDAEALDPASYKKIELYL